MSLDREVSRKLDVVLKNQATLDQHLHCIIRKLNIMGAAFDRLSAAVDANSAVTDDLSAEVAETIDYIKNHPHASDDPKLMALADKLEAKNAEAVKVKDDLDKAVGEAQEADHAAGM